MKRSTPIRIGLAGFSCECSTFSPLLSRRDDFRILTGDNLLSRYPFLKNYPDVEWVPLVRAGAIPGGPVETAFYMEFKEQLIAMLIASPPLDGLFLHMHGAAYVTGMEDMERDLYSAIRTVVGPRCLLSASYDLHGNLSPESVELLDILTAYRLAPHTDWLETVERAVRLLYQSIANNVSVKMAYVPVPVLLPGEKTCTDFEPAAGLYRRIPEIISEYSLLDASILIGYAWADEPRSGASVIALGTNTSQATAAARQLADEFWQLRQDFHFGVPHGSMDDCIRMAQQSDRLPVVISDSGDNPTAGGVGDSAYALSRCLEHEVAGVLIAGIADEPAVISCREAGPGSTVSLSLGATLAPSLSTPVEITADVLLIHQDMAVIRVQQIDVIVTEQRKPFHYLADFETLNIDPKRYDIICIKLGYLVPEIQQIAGTSLLALTPGAVSQDIRSLPFQRVRSVT